MESALHWTTSKWRADELDDRSVEFSLQDQHGAVVAGGIGRFIVNGRDDGLVAVRIEVDTPRSLTQRNLTRFSLQQQWVDRIEHHPDAKVAEFSIR